MSRGTSPSPNSPDDLSSKLRPHHAPRFLAVGRVVRPFGVRGELKVEIHTDYPERLHLHTHLWVGPDPQPYPLERVRMHKGYALIKLRGIETRSDAETLRNTWLWIPTEEAVPLEEDEYYEYQLLGLLVITTEGQTLGRITEILSTGANDVYVVRGHYGEVLLPAIAHVIREIDLDSGRMIVELLDGLL